MFNEQLVLEPHQLILVTGVGGSGKTVLCQELCQRIPGLNYVSKDQIADQFTDKRGEDYQKTVRDKVYALLHAAIKEKLALQTGSVLVDASCWKEIQAGPQWVNPYRVLAEQYGMRLRIIRVVLSEEDLRRNITQKRRSTYDDHKLKNPESWRNWLQKEPIHVDMPEGTLIVNNDGELDATVETVFQWLKDS